MKLLLVLNAIVICLWKSKSHGPFTTPVEDSRAVQNMEEQCKFYGFIDDELPSDYYKELLFKQNEELKMLKKQKNKDIDKIGSKSVEGKSFTSDEGTYLQMVELKADLTLLKSKVQFHDKLVVLFCLLVVFVAVVLCK